MKTIITKSMIALFIALAFIIITPMSNSLVIEYLHPETYNSLYTFTINDTTIISLPNTTLVPKFSLKNKIEIIGSEIDVSNYSKLEVVLSEIDVNPIIVSAYDSLQQQAQRYSFIKGYIFKTSLPENTNKFSFKDYNNDSNNKVIFYIPYTGNYTNQTITIGDIIWTQAEKFIPEQLDDLQIFNDKYGIYLIAIDNAETEICDDNIDNDFDGSIDEGCSQSTGSTGGSSSSSSSSKGSNRGSSGSPHYYKPGSWGNITSNTCKNKRLTGNETDIDCGGNECPSCQLNQTCIVNSDCESNYCNQETLLCSTPTCSDNIKNGLEIDIDCGGSCGLCEEYQTCFKNKDCISNYCSPNMKQCTTKPKPKPPVNNIPITPVEPPVVQETTPEIDIPKSNTSRTIISSLIILIIGAIIGVGAIVYKQQEHLKSHKPSFKPIDMPQLKPFEEITLPHSPEPRKSQVEKQEKVLVHEMSQHKSIQQNPEKKLLSFIEQGIRKGYRLKDLQDKLIAYGWPEKFVREKINHLITSHKTNQKGMSKFQLQTVEKFIRNELIHKYHMPDIKKALLNKEWPEKIVQEALFNVSNNIKIQRAIMPIKVKQISKKNPRVQPKTQTKKIMNIIPKRRINLSLLENFIINEYYRNTNKILLYNTFVRKKWPQYVIEQAFKNVERHMEEVKLHMNNKIYTEAIIRGLHTIKTLGKERFVQELTVRKYPEDIIKVLVIEVQRIQGYIKKELIQSKGSLQIKKAALATLNEKYNMMIIRKALELENIPTMQINQFLEE